MGLGVAGKMVLDNSDDSLLTALSGLDFDYCLEDAATLLERPPVGSSFVMD